MAMGAPHLEYRRHRRKEEQELLCRAASMAANGTGKGARWKVAIRSAETRRRLFRTPPLAGGERGAARDLRVGNAFRGMGVAICTECLENPSVPSLEQHQWNRQRGESQWQRT